MQHLLVDNARKEVVDDQVLVVEPHQPLNCRKIRERVLRARLLEQPVVEAMKQALQLRHDRVFVVARVTDQGALRQRLLFRQAACLGIVSRQVLRLRIVPAFDRLAEQESPGIIVHIGLIVRSTAINIVEVECRIPEVRKCVRVVLFLQGAVRIECQVVVYELAQVGVECGNSTFFIVLAIEWIVVFGSHRVGKLHEILQRLGFILPERRFRERGKHSAKAALE